VAAAALRLSERFVKTSPGGPLWSKVAAKAARSDTLHARERLQLAFTLGEVKSAEAEALSEGILRGNCDSALLRDATISGLTGRELEFLQRLAKAAAWRESLAGRPALVASLAKCVFAEAKPERASQLFDLAADETVPAWQRQQILGGLAGLVPKAAPGKQVVKPRLLKLPAEPAGLAALRKAGAAETLEQLAAIETLVTWPGKPGAEPEKVVTPLTKEEQARFDAGKELYLVTCGACHQPTGLGQEGLAPPLLDSAWSVGSEQRLIRIVLQGVRGKMTVKDKVYEMEMPPLGVLEDEQIAAALTYIRREWGHTAAPVDAATVAKVRKETESRLEAWTEADLLRIP
jgi:mono/diheme cytochrome c family protein